MNLARFHALRSLLVVRVALAGIAMTLSLNGCANPNFIGVQDFGYIVGNVVDSNGKPIVNAVVTATGSSTGGTGYSGQSGGFDLQNIAAGEQTVTATAAGYATSSPVTVIVVKGQGVQAGNIVLQSVLPAQ